MAELSRHVHDQSKVQAWKQGATDQSLSGISHSVPLSNANGHCLQAIVLLLFNDEDELTFAQIRESSSLEEKELKRTMHSLSCGKIKVLQKTPKSAEVQVGDTFAFNENFQDSRIRLCINTFQVRESDEESQKVHESIMQDRQYQIDAAIVRIMKMRKTLSHKLLMNELMTQLRFPYKTIDIKKRIESLIEREYMDRTLADPGVGRFVHGLTYHTFTLLDLSVHCVRVDVKMGQSDSAMQLKDVLRVIHCDTSAIRVCSIRESTDRKGRSLSAYIDTARDICTGMPLTCVVFWVYLYLSMILFALAIGSSSSSSSSSLLSRNVPDVSLFVED